ncbi:hypothetical protein [Chishuiella sp.]|uniref:hypothetical protein n=1 Tax=Chishuiella sp. TaxID=1969467 RepID=UPI0028AE84B2|nr:hypothetical protein [Chishuiella sp.]
MKKSIYIPKIGDPVFDFMQMKPEAIRVIDGELRVVFILECTDPKFKGYNFVLGINFNYNEYAIDERFPNYYYTELDSVHSIKLFDSDMEYEYNESTTSKILQIARAMTPRKYREILTVSSYASIKKESQTPKRMY